MFCACQQIRVFKKNDGDTSVRELDYDSDSNMIFTGRIPRGCSHTSREFPNASVYFSAILLKLGRNFNSITNYVNNEFFNLRLGNQKVKLIQLGNSAVNHDLNYEFLRKDKIHTRNNGLRQLANTLFYM